MGTGFLLMGILRKGKLMASKLSNVVGRKWLAFVFVLLGVAAICLFQPALMEYAIEAGFYLGLVYLSWQGLDDLVEKHYEFKAKELVYKYKPGAPKV